MKTTTIDVRGLPLDIEGHPTMLPHMGGIASADKLVSPHYFEDAMFVTPFCILEANLTFPSCVAPMPPMLFSWYLPS